MIEIFDDKIPFVDRQHIYHFSIKSHFRLVGWADRDDVDIAKQDLHSKWSLEDLKNSKLYTYVQDAFKKSKKFKNKLLFDRCVLNLVKPNDYYYPHTHNKKNTVALYYVNLDWKHYYGGETIFYDNDLKNITYTSPYVPGRLLLFKGDIPHIIKSQTINGPSNRFTISIFFKNEDKA